MRIEIDVDAVTLDTICRELERQVIGAEEVEAEILRLVNRVQDLRRQRDGFEQGSALYAGVLSVNLDREQAKKGGK